MKIKFMLNLPNDITEDYIPVCHDFIVFLCYNNCQVVGLGLQSRGSRVIRS